MFRSLRFWKLVLAFLMLTAFAAAAGHEAVHVAHSSHCTVCRVTQANPSALAVHVVSLITAALIFMLVTLRQQRPVSSVRSILSGRAPPTTLL